MAQNVTEVFRVTVPSVGLVLKARADINGKQSAYQKRIAEDFPNDEAAALTEYSANVDCGHSEVPMGSYPIAIPVVVAAGR